MEKTNLLFAINEAIWLRDNYQQISDEVLVNKIVTLSNYGVYSNRQLSDLVKNKIKHSVIGKHTQKKDKSGGKLAPESLDFIKEFFFSVESSTPDYNLARKATLMGTSQGMISRLTGVPQSTLSRKMIG